MTDNRNRVRLAGGVLMLLLPLVFAAAGAHADTGAAHDCATKLPPDARSIFDATLPQVGPGADMRSLLTATTRKLAFSGAIELGSARESATAAAQCLRLAAN